MEKIIVDILGWTGMVLVLLAYLLISTGQFSGNSIIYQILNIVGSAFLIINTLYYGAVPSAALNVAWLLIGLFSIFRIKPNKQLQ